MADTAETVRPATLHDVPAIVDAYQQIWFGNQGWEELIEDILADPNHELLVAEAEQRVVGFVDSFATTAADGTLRWEVDNIGVMERFRQRGLARRLVEATTETGRARGATLARALILTENVASQRTFARNGYTTDGVEQVIYTWGPSLSEPGEGEEPFHLIPVRSMSYRGFWLEPPLTLASVAAAQRAVLAQGGRFVGSVVPLNQPRSIFAAARSRFQLSGYKYHTYQWWIKGIRY